MKQKKERQMRVAGISKMVIIALVAANLCSCATSVQNGALGGAAIGAGAGQLATGDTKGTIIGGAAGLLVGGILGAFVDMDENAKERNEIERNKNLSTGHEQEYIEVERKKVITVKDKVAVQKETRKYYIDPSTGRKIFVK